MYLFSALQSVSWEPQPPCTIFKPHCYSNLLTWNMLFMQPQSDKENEKNRIIFQFYVQNKHIEAPNPLFFTPCQLL